jgi:hypothetical protein
MFEIDWNKVKVGSLGNSSREVEVDGDKEVMRVVR